MTTFAYAEEIARDWSSTQAAPENIGFVTEFEIEATAAADYPIQNAGGRAHQELWVPAESLERFNDCIVGEIRVIAGYRNAIRVENVSLAEVEKYLRPAK